VAPGTGAVSSAQVRDGDVYLDRALPFGLVCERPDPRDPRRAFGCRMMEQSAQASQELSLAPGYTTTLGDLSFEPIAERLRNAAEDEAADLVLTRRAPEASVERLRLEPGKTVALRAGGEEVTAFPGPDGPLLVVERDGHATLLAPPTSARPEVGELPLGFEAQPATALLVQVTSAPEALLVLAGTLLFVLGLGLMALVPHLEVELTPAGQGTAVTFWSSNRPTRPREALARLLPKEPDA